MAKGKGKSGYSLAQIDQMMRDAYKEVRAELTVLDRELAELAAKRDGLAERARQLELGLGLSDASAAAEPAPAAAPAPSGKPKSTKPAKAEKSSKPAKSTKGKKSNGRKTRARGALWHDVQSVMKGKGNMQASKVIEALVAKLSYDDSESVRTRVYNSLGRWAREGKLKKSGRGVYSL